MAFGKPFFGGPVREEDLTAQNLGRQSCQAGRRIGERVNARFEGAAWHKDRRGTVLLVVEMLKSDPRKDEVQG